MYTYSRILIHLDGSRLSEQAMPSAICMARQANGRLLLLQAISTRHPSTDECDAVLAYLSHMAAEAEEAGAPAEYLVVTGPVGSAVVQAAHEHAADLIMLTSHEENDVRRVLVRSVATHVIRTSPVPVLILKQRAILPTSLAKAGGRQEACWAVAALDGSAQAERSAEAVAGLLWSLNGRSANPGVDGSTLPMRLYLHLVRVVDLSSMLWEATFNTRRAFGNSIIERKTAKMRPHSGLACASAHRRRPAPRSW